jgi:ABC-type nickel/cobalt efflux system permease component RcnA
VTTFCGLIKALLSAAVAIGIPIAVLFIVWAGLKFVLAKGNSTKLTEARTNMLYTVIGIGIFLGAWLLVMVIQNTVNGLASGSGQSVISSCN